MARPSARAGSCLLLLSAALLVRGAPLTRYDQRQEGELNVHAHLENFIILLIPSSGSGLFNIAAKIAPARQQPGKRVEGTAGHSVVGAGVAGHGDAGPAGPPKGVKAPPYKVDIDASKHGPLVVELTAPHEVVIAESPSVSLRPTKGPSETKDTAKEIESKIDEPEAPVPKKDLPKEEEHKEEEPSVKTATQEEKSRAAKIEVLRTGLEPAPMAPCAIDEQRDRKGHCRSVFMPTRISKSYPSAELLKSLREGLVPAH